MPIVVSKFFLSEFHPAAIEGLRHHNGMWRRHKPVAHGERPPGRFNEDSGIFLGMTSTHLEETAWVPKHRYA